MTKLFGLLGEKLSHTISPKVHEHIFKELNMNGYYHTFEVQRESLKDAVYGLKALGVKGVNVTIPYKISVTEFLDELSQEAKKIGAVNTIVFDGNITKGYNTDYYGFGMTLDRYGIKVKNQNALILGNGGVAKSVIQYLLDNGIGDLKVAVRSKDKYFKERREGIELIEFNELQKFDRIKQGNIIINCTPCGMYGSTEGSPVDRKIIEGFNAVVDLIYNPKETVFLKYAKEVNIKSANGLYMLVGQAVAAQELWNNVKIDRSIADNIYDKINSAEGLIY